jgi:hypothetical protein
MLRLILSIAMFCAFMSSASAVAPVCGPTEVYKSASTLPNGATFILEPGLYEDGYKLYSISYLSSDDTGLCKWLGFETSQGAIAELPQDPTALKCISIDVDSKMTKAECDSEYYKGITCL